MISQRPTTTPAFVRTLAWLVSPITGSGSELTFSWKLNYQFMWSLTGQLQPGVNVKVLGLKDGSPDGNNVTNFTIKDGYLGLYDTTGGTDKPKGTLNVVVGRDIVPETFSVGLAIFQHGIFASNAEPNMTYAFILNPNPPYYVCATMGMNEGDVIDIETMAQCMQFHFPPNVYRLCVTFTSDKTWTVSPA